MARNAVWLALAVACYALWGPVEFTDYGSGRQEQWGLLGYRVVRVTTDGDRITVRRNDRAATVTACLTAALTAGAVVAALALKEAARDRERRGLTFSDPTR